MKFRVKMLLVVFVIFVLVPFAIYTYTLQISFAEAENIRQQQFEKYIQPLQELNLGVFGEAQSDLEQVLPLQSDPVYGLYILERLAAEEGVNLANPVYFLDSRSKFEQEGVTLRIVAMGAPENIEDFFVRLSNIQPLLSIQSLRATSSLSGEYTVTLEIKAIEQKFLAEAIQTLEGKLEEQVTTRLSPQVKNIHSFVEKLTNLIFEGLGESTLGKTDPFGE